jgi:DNA helicase-2/ATP-dependent DNA helicase PcrA
MEINKSPVLNPEQLEAVHHVEGPLLVIAGAGSGKTRVVTFRIVHLLELGISEYSILGLTFTNKAAEEMKERVRNLTSKHVLISTFHSLGARILRESIESLGYKRDFVIYDEEDTEKILKACMDALELPDKKEAKIFRQLISKAKNDLLKPEEVDTSEYSSSAEKYFPELYKLYQARLKECNALDFDDLLYLPVRLFREFPQTLDMYQNRWKYLLIDEYQDTNAAQYEMVRLLAEKLRNLFVVGDPDQSIYSWRGASVSNILNFEIDYPGAKIIRLEQNYRSKANILNAANALILNNDSRYEKNLWSDLGDGDKIKIYTAEDDQSEAAYVTNLIRTFHMDHRIPLKEIVIFYRTNFQSRVFEDALLFKRIPYVIVGGISFYQRREIKDILSFLRIIHSSSDFIAFVRTLNLPKRGIGASTIEKLQLASSMENMSILEYCQALVYEDQHLQTPVKLSAKQKEGLKEYIGIIAKFKKIAKEGSLRDLVWATVYDSHYLQVLKEEPDSYNDRKENLDELIAKATEWEENSEDKSLGKFLEELSLKSSMDENEYSDEKVRLMTLHNGKGLEFTVTFLVGMEEDLLPHINSKGEGNALEEERRLCYVGITRAKQFLYITNARSRFLWGVRRSMYPSRFLREIPDKYKEKVSGFRI